MAQDWFPDAIKKQIGVKTRPRGGVKGDAFILHIAVSNAPSLYSFFSRRNVGCSHFYVRKDGTIEQYLPVSSKSSSELEGNAHTISVETQGGTSADAEHPWTEQQVESLADIYAWLNKQWGVPFRKMTSSDKTEKGIGWHRLGIDGNFPSSGAFKGRKQIGHGELWSNAYGKTCPENFASPKNSQSRILQVDKVLSLAKGSTPPPKPPNPTDNIAVDGYWGYETTSALQHLFGTENDGEVWNQNVAYKADNPGLAGGWIWTSDPAKIKKGSPLIREMQEFLNDQDNAGLTEDGSIGPKTIKAIQKRMTKLGFYKGTIDGEFFAPSDSIKAMQKAINKKLHEA